MTVGVKAGFKFVAVAACAFAFGFLPAKAVAQGNWPDNAVKVIVPFPAGGGTDIVARLLVEKLNAGIANHFIVENRPGASTMIGTEAVARAAPDGYTLLFTSSTYSVNPSLQKSINFDTKKSFIPIGMMAFHPFVLLAHPSLKVSTLAELIQLAKSKPGEINYASVGAGSSQHLGMELLKQLANINLTHVPYRGSSPAMNDLLGGHVGVMWNGLSPSIGLIQQGKLKALAVDTKSRVPLVNEVATVEEAGIKGYDITTWSGLFAPAGTPDAIVDRLVAAMKEIQADPKVQQRLAELGLQPGSLSKAAFAKYLDDDMANWAKLIASTGIKLD